MQRFIALTAFIAAACLLSTAAYGIQSAEVQAGEANQKIVRTKLENNAMNTLKVKRLKKLLETNKIDSDRFFGEIEKMVNRRAAQ